ncbi:hypothetical protein IFR05_004244 [Cadophora sp. M221]|nr:hypothetical protein IFR05_004244 [Cadophora sp. M221]
MYWTLFTVGWKAVRALSSKTGSGSNTANTSSSSTVLLQLTLSFISFIVTFLALLLVEPPCSTTHSRIHTLLSFSTYTFLITTLLTLILLALNPPTSFTSHPRSTDIGIGKWRGRLLTYGTIICWVKILLAFLALAITIAVHHISPEVFNIIALIGITVLTLGVLIFAICPEHPLSSPTNRAEIDEMTDKDLKSAEKNRKRERERELNTEEQRKEKSKRKETERERQREWEDPLSSPITPTYPHAHMPLTPTPGDEKTAFAKAQAERLARLREGGDIKPWKKWIVLGVFVVQGICLLILFILGIKLLVDGGVGVGSGEGGGCGGVKVEVMGCVNSCAGNAGGEVGVGGKEEMTFTVTETEIESSTVLGTTVRTLTETVRETQTQTLREELRRQVQILAQVERRVV